MAARKKSEGGLDQSIESFRASLERTVTVSLERLQEVLDDAVDRGRMTRRDAEALVGELIDKGRRQRNQLLDELERIGRQIGKHSEKVARQARVVTDKPLATAEKKLRRRGGKSATSASGRTSAAKAAPKSAAGAKKPKAFPIADYDSLNATEVRKRLEGLSAAELKTVRKREEAGKARKTVLAEIEKRLA